MELEKVWNRKKCGIRSSEAESWRGQIRAPGGRSAKAIGMIGFDRAYGRSRQELIVLGVGADPEPDDPFRFFDGQRTIVNSDTHGPQMFCPADSLELQRGVMRVALQESEVLVGQLLDFFGQLPVVLPEPGQSVVPHNGWAKPDWCSRSTSASNASSRPDSRSASIWRSQTCPSRFCSQAISSASSLGGSRLIADSISVTLMRSNPLGKLR